MESIAASLAAGAAAFAATNLDDLFLLVAWFAAGRYRARDIVLGQYAGIAVLFAASLAASLAAVAMAAEHLRWLGVLPVGIGLDLLLRSRQEHAEELAPASSLLAVATVTVANGTDNLGVYIPLFATSSTPAIATMGAVFAIMTALWCAGAHWLVHHPAAGTPIRRWGPRAVPYVLVGIGLWILLR